MVYHNVLVFFLCVFPVGNQYVYLKITFPKGKNVFRV